MVNNIPRCSKCDKNFKSFPFTCKFCREQFCEDHRLPEDHKCDGLSRRKEFIKEKIKRGEKILYSPVVRKEIKMNFDDSNQNIKLVENNSFSNKNLISPLFRGTIPIIGYIVASISIVGVLILIFSSL